jgi:hypothetical protein
MLEFKKSRIQRGGARGVVLVLVLVLVLGDPDDLASKMRTGVRIWLVVWLGNTRSFQIRSERDNPVRNGA